MQLTLDEISILCVYSAMVMYAIAFIAFSIDLAPLLPEEVNRWYAARRAI